MLTKILINKDSINLVMSFVVGIVVAIVAGSNPQPPGAPPPLYMRDDSEY